MLILQQISSNILNVIFLLISIAYFTLAERKVMASIQRRRGPNVVGIWGLLQPLADGLKALFKELIIPRRANNILFMLAATLTFILSLFNWIFIPLTEQQRYDIVSITKNSLISVRETLNNQVDITIDILKSYKWFLDSLSVPPTLNIYNLSFFDFLHLHTFVNFNWNLNNNEITLLFIFAVSSLNVYGIILAGWASNSKYAFLGAMRSAAQMISYEVSIGLLIIPIVIVSMSLNLIEIIEAQKKIIFAIPFLPLVLMFFISVLAETNRTPFDLPEAEAELVAGYNVEYSAISFAMFFLGEYSNMLLMSTLTVFLFFGGWISYDNISNISIFIIKSMIIAFLFILFRAILPRYRFDQLMNIGWKIFLPYSLSWLLVFSLIGPFKNIIYN